MNKKEAPMNAVARIDVHQHIIPPEFREALERHAMGNWAQFPWSETGALAFMDEFGIETGMLSLSTPGPHLGDDAEARALTLAVNERMAAMVQRRPGRFGLLASIPLPDIDGSLAAIAHAYDELSADGVLLLSNTHGIYLGDPRFDPVMAELDRRSAVVLVHPAHLEGRPVPGLHPALADFLLDTTRASINLVLQGWPRRFPNIRVILSHAGGFLPYAAHRIAVLAHVIDHKVDTDDTLAGLSSFYFDTALASSPTALPSLKAFAKPSHMLFGSDSPYCDSATVARFTANLDAYDGFDNAHHHAVNRANAAALFPRLQARSS